MLQKMEKFCDIGIKSICTYFGKDVITGTYILIALFGN